LSPAEGAATIALRPATPDDAEALWRLQRALAADGRGMVVLPEEIPDSPDEQRAQLEGFARRPGDLFLVAERDGVVVGSVDVTRIPRLQLAHNGYLTMGVHPDAQGRGVGRRLLQAAVAQASAAGVLNLELNVLAANARAIALYRSMGFVEVLRRERFLRRPDGSWLDDLLMILRCE